MYSFVFWKRRKQRYICVESVIARDPLAHQTTLMTKPWSRCSPTAPRTSLRAVSRCPEMTMPRWSSVRREVTSTSSRAGNRSLGALQPPRFDVVTECPRFVASAPWWIRSRSAVLTCRPCAPNDSSCSVFTEPARTAAATTMISKSTKKRGAAARSEYERRFRKRSRNDMRLIRRASLTLMLSLCSACGQSEKDAVILLCGLSEKFDLSDGTGEPFRVIAWLDGRLTNDAAKRRFQRIGTLDKPDRADAMDSWARSVGVHDCSLADWYGSQGP